MQRRRLLQCVTQALTPVLLPLLRPGTAQAQPQLQEPAATAPPASGTAAAASLLERIRALGLVAAPGRVTAWHPEGLGPRAQALQGLIDDALAHLHEQLRFSRPMHLALLTREQWQAVIEGQPYGIPGVAGHPPVIFMPAGDDGLAAEDARSLRDRVAPATMRQLAAAGYGWDEAARRYVDLVGLHEVGHVVVHGLGIRANCRWLDELLATYVAYACLRARRPVLAPLWEGVLQGYVDAVQPEHRSLVAFDRLCFRVGAQNYVWYQAQFQRLVRTAYEARGLDLLRDLQPVFATPVVAPLAPEIILRRLEPLLPGAREWAASVETPTVVR